ncbi:MAG: xanthine phosphoribosyltransferase [Amylibacter sp.]
MTERLPHEKGFHISWDQIHRDSRALAWRLDGKGPIDGTWKAIVAITRGGMAPAMIIARELDVRTVDTISVKSYSHQDQSEAKVLKAADTDIIGDGTGVLIIDDLVDSGKTLKLVRDLYPNAHYATVYAKPEGRSMVETFITEVSQDTWLYFPWDMALQYVEPYRGV